MIGVVISATGTLKFVNEKGETITFIVPAAVTSETVTALPFTLWGRVRQILSTGTTIPDASLHGLTTT